MSPTAHEQAVSDLLHRLAEHAETRSISGPRALEADLRPAPRRRWPTAMAAAMLLVAALAGASLAVRDRSDGSDRSAPRVALDGGQGPVAGATTERLSSSGLSARRAAASVWTGKELLVWGGMTFDGSRSLWLADGAALDPVANRWRPLPPAPIGPRSDAAAVWTGGEMVVWGGYSGDEALTDGAAFDPHTNRWRPIADQPFGGATRPAVVWTGTEMLVFAGANHFGTSAYDPGTDRWRGLASPPGALAMPYPQAVWTGSQAVLVLWPSGSGGFSLGSDGQLTRVGELPDPGSGSAPVPGSPPGTPPPPAVRGPNSDMFLAAYSPESDQWARLPAVALKDGGLPRLAWTGREILALQHGLPGAAFDPERESWRQLAAPPPGTVIRVDPVWSGRHALLWSGGELGLAYDVENDAWWTFDGGGLPTRGDTHVVWADGLLVGWGGSTSGEEGGRPDSEGIRYRPPG